MTWVGNDVVDLDDAAIATSHLRERFVARVCHPSERELLQVAPDPKVLLWSLFAAKEAAFKLVSKRGPPPIFAHRQFVVSTDLTFVQYGDFRANLRVRVAGPCVHAVAFSEDGEPLSATGVLVEGGNESEAARALLFHHLSRELAWSGLEVVRELIPGSWDGHGPPRLFRDGQPTGVDISLSHDGRFVAFAAACRG